MTTNYIDKKKFLNEVCDYKKQLRNARVKKLEKPQMPNQLGSSFYLIAEKCSHHAWFRGYPDTIKEDMISDAIYHCIKYVDTFNPRKTKEAFAYFTRVVFHAFRHRVDKERKMLYTKLKAIEDAELFSMLSDRQGHDEIDYGSEEVAYSEGAKENRNEFIRKFEDSLRKKKIKEKAKKKLKEKQVKVLKK